MRNSIGSTGIVIEPGVSEDEWRKLAIDLHSSFSNWDLGEWVVYGLDNFDAAKTEKAAKEIFNETWTTLRNRARTIRGVSRERRSTKAPLTFSHYARVYSYPPDMQERLLQRCVAENLSVAQLADLIVREYPHLMARPPKIKQDPTVGRKMDSIRITYVPDVDRLDLIFDDQPFTFQPTSSDHFVARVDATGHIVGISIYAAANIKAPVELQLSVSAHEN